MGGNDSRLSCTHGKLACKSALSVKWKPPGSPFSPRHGTGLISSSYEGLGGTPWLLSLVTCQGLWLREQGPTCRTSRQRGPLQSCCWLRDAGGRTRHFVPHRALDNAISTEDHSFLHVQSGLAAWGAQGAGDKVRATWVHCHPRGPYPRHWSIFSALLQDREHCVKASEGDAV